MRRNGPQSMLTMSVKEDHFHEPILQQMYADLVKCINAVSILDHMQDKVSDGDRQQITAERKNSGLIAAARLLLSILRRAYPDAFIKFVEAVFQTTPGAAGWQLAKKMYDLVPEEFRCGKYQFSESFVQALKEKSSSDDLAESKEQDADSSTMNELSYPGLRGDNPCRNFPSQRPTSDPCLYNQAEHPSQNISRSQSMVCDTSLEDNTGVESCRMLKDVKWGTVLRLSEVLNKDKRWDDLHVCHDLSCEEYMEVQDGRNPFVQLFQRLMKKNWAVENLITAVQDNLPDILDEVCDILECQPCTGAVADNKINNQARMHSMPDTSVPVDNTQQCFGAAQIRPDCPTTTRLDPDTQPCQNIYQPIPKGQLTNQVSSDARPLNASVPGVLSAAPAQPTPILQREGSGQSSSQSSINQTSQKNPLSARGGGTCGSNLGSSSVSSGNSRSGQSSTRGHHPEAYQWENTEGLGLKAALLSYSRAESEAAHAVGPTGPEHVQQPSGRQTENARTVGSTPSLASGRSPPAERKLNVTEFGPTQTGAHQPQSDPLGQQAGKGPCIEAARIREDISNEHIPQEDVPSGPHPAEGDKLDIQAQKNPAAELQRLQEDRRAAEFVEGEMRGFQNMHTGGPPPASRNGVQGASTTAINVRPDNCAIVTQSNSSNISSPGVQSQSGDTRHEASTQGENSEAREQVSAAELVSVRQEEPLSQATEVVSQEQAQRLVSTTEAKYLQGASTECQSVSAGQASPDRSENIRRPSYLKQPKIDLLDSSSGSLSSSEVLETTGQAPTDDRITESEASRAQNTVTVSNSKNLDGSSNSSAGEMNDNNVVDDDVVNEVAVDNDVAMTTEQEEGNLTESCS